MLHVLSDQAQHRLVYTQDESWIHWRNPRKLMRMKSVISPPAKLRRCLHSKKQMVSVIFNSEGVVSIVFLPPEDHFTERFIEDVGIEDFVSKVEIPKTRDKNRKVKFDSDNLRTLDRRETARVECPTISSSHHIVPTWRHATSSCLDP